MNLLSKKLKRKKKHLKNPQHKHLQINLQKSHHPLKEDQLESPGKEVRANQGETTTQEPQGRTFQLSWKDKRTYRRMKTFLQPRNLTICLYATS
jgi:hypothetical protein